MTLPSDLFFVPSSTHSTKQDQHSAPKKAKCRRPSRCIAHKQKRARCPSSVILLSTNSLSFSFSLFSTTLLLKQLFNDLRLTRRTSLTTSRFYVPINLDFSHHGGQRCKFSAVACHQRNDRSRPTSASKYNRLHEHCKQRQPKKDPCLHNLSTSIQ